MEQSRGVGCAYLIMILRRRSAFEIPPNFGPDQKT